MDAAGGTQGHPEPGSSGHTGGSGARPGAVGRRTRTGALVCLWERELRENLGNHITSIAGKGMEKALLAHFHTHEEAHLHFPPDLDSGTDPPPQHPALSLPSPCTHSTSAPFQGCSCVSSLQSSCRIPPLPVTPSIPPLFLLIAHLGMLRVPSCPPSIRKSLAVAALLSCPFSAHPAPAESLSLSRPRFFAPVPALSQSLPLPVHLMPVLSLLQAADRTPGSPPLPQS